MARRYAKVRGTRRFNKFLQSKELGFLVFGELHIYVGGKYGTTWRFLLPIYRQALINEYNQAFACK